MAHPCLRPIEGLSTGITDGGSVARSARHHLTDINIRRAARVSL
jgi:hypothetical protein